MPQHPSSASSNGDLAIRNTIARYCHALDTKDFSLLDAVFTADVDASYPFNTAMRGVDEVRDAIMGRIGPILTQHHLTTQVITLSPSKNSAEANTYFTAAHFGQGPHEGKLLTAYGRYVDELVLVDVGSGRRADWGEDTEERVWRIRRREVHFVKRIGEERIMREF